LAQTLCDKRLTQTCNERKAWVVSRPHFCLLKRSIVQASPARRNVRRAEIVEVFVWPMPNLNDLVFYLYYRRRRVILFAGLRPGS
jgi:hypothetical protein